MVWGCIYVGAEAPFTLTLCSLFRKHNVLHPLTQSFYWEYMMVRYCDNPQEGRDLRTEEGRRQRSRSLTPWNSVYCRGGDAAAGNRHRTYIHNSMLCKVTPGKTMQEAGASRKDAWTTEPLAWKVLHL